MFDQNRAVLAMVSRVEMSSKRFSRVAHLHIVSQVLCLEDFLVPAVLVIPCK